MPCPAWESAAHDKDMVVVNQPSSLAHMPPLRPYRKFPHGCCQRAIMVLFHLSPFKHFKVFYHYGIGQQHRACFRELPHYDRFVGLMPRLFAPLMVLLHSLSGAQTGIYFADSTKLAVCH